MANNKNTLVFLYVDRCVSTVSRVSRWSGFLLCAVAMLLVIFPMFTFPKKLPPRHKKKKRRKKLSLDDLSSDDDVLKEKSNNKSQAVTSSMGFGKDIKGTREYCDIISDVSSLSLTSLMMLSTRNELCTESGAAEEPQGFPISNAPLNADQKCVLE